MQWNYNCHFKVEQHLILEKAHCKSKLQSTLEYLIIENMRICLKISCQVSFMLLRICKISENSEIGVQIALISAKLGDCFLNFISISI